MYAYFNSMKLDLRGKKGSIGCYGEMKLPGRDSVGTGRNDDACIRTSQWRWGCKVISIYNSEAQRLEFLTLGWERSKECLTKCFV